MQSSKVKPNLKQITNDVRAIRAIITYGRGIQKSNPKRCLTCKKPIRAGEAWERYTTPLEPGSGASYSVIVHARCDRQNGKH